MAVVWLALPVIGLLERAGLKEQRAMLISPMLTSRRPGALLLVYLAVRQITAALGLTSLGGHAQMVRPLIAPMARGARRRIGLGEAADAHAYRIRAHAAAADNIGVFFGEDIFIAIGSILLIRGFLDQNGIHVEPTALARLGDPDGDLRASSFTARGCCCSTGRWRTRAAARLDRGTSAPKPPRTSDVA